MILYILHGIFACYFDRPYSNVPVDYFNFYHSRARIIVERTFGETKLRWGIFWKWLCCNLDNSTLTIEGAIHLHNISLIKQKNMIEYINYQLTMVFLEMAWMVRVTVLLMWETILVDQL